MSRPNGNQVTIGVMIALILGMGGLIGAEAWNRVQKNRPAKPAAVVPVEAVEAAPEPAKPAPAAQQPAERFPQGGDG